MKAFFWLWTMLLAAPHLLAGDIGLYDIRDRFHPKPLLDHISQTTISSQSNDNQRYYLQFRASHFFSLPCGSIGLIVAGKTVTFDSQGQDNQGHYTSMETWIDDRKLVPLIAKQFHAKVLERHHPGHRMLAQFITNKAEFPLGGPVEVSLRISNIGSTDFAFMEGGRQRGARNNQFAFTAQLEDKMVLDAGNPINYGGLAMSVRLKPGQSHEINVDLVKWFSFKEGGTYELRGSYYMEFVDPSEHDLNVIWEDYACAEFKVIIKQ